MQKIEELTLYMIEMKKNNNFQSNRLKVLEEENTALRNRISLLEKKLIISAIFTIPLLLGMFLPFKILHNQYFYFSVVLSYYPF